MKELALGALMGHGLWLPLTAFLLLGGVIFAVASRLARAADTIADATGLGRAWIGAILLAGSTSLPEITTDVNAALLGVPDIGVGGLMGSTLANMLILALLDLVYARRHLLQSVAVNHAVVGLLAIALTMIAGIAMSTGGFGRIGPVGIETVLIIVVYVLGMRVFYQLTSVAAQGLIPSEPAAASRPAAENRVRLRRAVWTFAVAAAVLIIVAPLLVISAEAVSAESGMSTTFVGTLLVGLTTSFPEIAATVAAVRLGAIDLAVGNIFGSNAFNMCVLFFMDLSYSDGPLLAEVSREHVMTAQLATLCLSFGVLAIMGRLERRSAVARFESLLIVGCYAAGIWLLARG
ncbi:MAG: sodium:calcium antiporter [Steroidobacteraceae bacterium]